MTDITELAQSLKAAANREMVSRDLAETSRVWQDSATPENILALVEALEKAQQLETQAAEMAIQISKRLAEAYKRVTELESRTVTVKLPPKIERNDADGWFMYNGGRVGGGAAEWYNKALDDVISAQPTFVTVQLPEPYAYLRENDGQIQISIGAERPSDRSGGYATPWFAIYTAVGIKWEAE
ncbi:hypothetical protein [Klebsiella aerogenes]|uniref:hypothetical protein n=1 Tax=Klebsiella aerogenes TaxID=548 RepID=UPI003A7FB872